MSNKRRPTTFIETSTPCQCCAFPFSERHHLFGFAKYGENEITVQLCPNCHGIYQLIVQAGRDNKQSQELLRRFMLNQKLCDEYFSPLSELQRDVAVIEKADEHRRELLERDREAIEHRIEAGELRDNISTEYWDKVGVAPASLRASIATVESWVSGHGRGPLASQRDLRSQAVDELLNEWMADMSGRPEGEQAIQAAIERRMNEIKNRVLAHSGA